MVIHLSVNVCDQRWRAKTDESQYTKVYTTFYKLINQRWASAEARKPTGELQKSNTATYCGSAPVYQKKKKYEISGTHSGIKMRTRALPNTVILCFLVKRDDH